MFITDIKINEIRHLKNIDINLGDEKHHLILTGKNGSGKTTLLKYLHCYLRRIKDGGYLNKEENFKQIKETQEQIDALSLPNKNTLKRQNQSQHELNLIPHLMTLKCKNKVFETLELLFSDKLTEQETITKDNFVVKFFEAKRNSQMETPQGVEKIDLESIKDSGQAWFLKYMVHLETQLAYANQENDIKEVARINGWFNRFRALLKNLFEEENIELRYNRRNYNFTIKQGVKEFSFNELSDGFSATLDIITSIMMSMEKEEEELHLYDMYGIVLIDEIDTHLHISLQKSIFKILTDFFPNIQFIVTTHSPFVINSVENAIVYDLEQQEKLEHMEVFSYEDIAELHFGAKDYNKIILDKLKEYKELTEIVNKTSTQMEDFNALKNYFHKVKDHLPKQIELKVWEIEEESK